MPREVNNVQPFADKLVKLIPTEILAAYLAIASMLGFNPSELSGTAQGLNTILIQIVFFVLLVLTPLYLWRVTGVTNKLQLIVTTASFIVWFTLLVGHSQCGSCIIPSSVRLF